MPPEGIFQSGARLVPGAPIRQPFLKAGFQVDFGRSPLPSTNPNVEAWHGRDEHGEPVLALVMNRQHALAPDEVARALAVAKGPVNVGYVFSDVEHAVPELHTPQLDRPMPEHLEGWARLASRLFAQRLRPEFPPGAVLSDGSAQKRVYTVEGNRDVLIRMMKDLPAGPQRHVRQRGPAMERAWLLIKEYNDLNFLRARGFPVLSIRSTGRLEGKPADVVERFDVASKDADVVDGKPIRPASNMSLGPRWKRLAPELVNAQTDRDLNQAFSAIERGVAIHDLQFLLKEGRLVIFDPAAIVTREQQPESYARFREQNLRLLDEIAAAS